MRGLRQAVSMAAILAIALHGLLLGLATLEASADPSMVICHAGASAAVPDAPAPADADRVHPCDHCSPCSAVAMPPPPANVAGARLAPRPLIRLATTDAAPGTGLLGQPRPRGPPRSA